MKLGSLFDGIGGFPLAGLRHGFTPVWASEIEPFPIRVTKIHFPGMVHLGDITKINGADIEPVNLICGGSPCQDLSVAGKRAGLAGSRSGLYMEQIRIIREMRNASANRYPRFMLWENVPGAFSSNGGEDFRAVIKEAAKTADETASIPRPKDGKWNTVGCIMADGYSIAWRVLDAQYWGVPQRRRRIFLVADFDGQSAPEILFKREGLRRDIAQGREEGQGAAGDVDGGAGETVKCLTPWDCQSKQIFDPAGKYPTLQAMDCGGANNTAIFRKDTRPHNAPMDRYGTLRAHASGGNEGCVAVAFMSGNTGSIGYAEELSPTLKSDAGGNTVPAIAIDCRNHRAQDVSGTIQSKQGGGYSLNYINPIAHPLLAKSNLSFREDIDTLVMAHGQANAEILMDQCPTLNCNHEQPIAASQYAVRRLIPNECCRLQGYPDGWCDIPGASDSAQYKAYGNSVAIPCVEYVMEGIQEVHHGN